MCTPVCGNRMLVPQVTIEDNFLRHMKLISTIYTLYNFAIKVVHNEVERMYGLLSHIIIVIYMHVYALRIFLTTDFQTYFCTSELSSLSSFPRSLLRISCPTLK